MISTTWLTTLGHINLANDARPYQNMKEAVRAASDPDRQEKARKKKQKEREKRREEEEP